MKKKVLRCRLKTGSDDDDVTSAGRVLYGGWGGCIIYCYITQPDFFHRDPTSWAIHEYGENKTAN